MILQVPLFRSFFFSSNIVVLSAMVHATRKRKLCQLPSWKAEADGKKCWASKMEEMKSITLEIFFWKAFWKDMDGFFPPVREKNIEGLRFNLLWKPTWLTKHLISPSEGRVMPLFLAFRGFQWGPIRFWWAILAGLSPIFSRGEIS